MSSAITSKTTSAMNATSGGSGGANSGTLRIQIRSPSGERKVVTVSPSMAWGAFQTLVHSTVGRPANSLLISVGFPPEEIKETDASKPISTLEPRPIKNNDTIVTHEKNLANVVIEGKGWEYPPTISPNRGSFFRKAMPGDNSCLFHSINYTLRNKLQDKEKLGELREIASNVVSTDPQKWNSAILGMSNSLYQHHIMSPNVWGGEIELVVFSEHFEAEIVAMDYLNLHESVFGEGRGFKRRVFLLYHATEANAHYDVLSYSPSVAGSAAAYATDDQVIFSTQDNVAWERVRSFVEGLHKDAAKAGRCTLQKEWHRQIPKRRLPAGQRLSGEPTPTFVGGTGAVGSAATSPRNMGIESKTSEAKMGEAKTSTPPNRTYAETEDPDLMRAIEASLRTAEQPKTTSTPPAATVTTSTRPGASSTTGTTAAPSQPTSRHTQPPSRSSPPQASSQPRDEWECPACSYRNPTFPPSCEVCGTKNPLFPVDDDDTYVSPAPMTTRDAGGEWVGDTYIRPPDQVRTQRLIGGDDDDDVFDPATLLSIPAWTCPRCTVRNEAGSLYCSVCQNPHASLGLTSGAAGGFNGAAGGNQMGGSETRRGWFDWLTGRGEELWECAECGTRQSYRLIACKTCHTPNFALLSRANQDNGNRGGGQTCTIS